MQRAGAELDEEDAPVDGVEADLQGVSAPWLLASINGWRCVQADDPTFVFGIHGNRTISGAILPLPQPAAGTLFVVNVVTFSDALDTSTC